METDQQELFHTSTSAAVHINEDLLCEIVSFMPFFYQWKLKRINSLCFRIIERIQKKLLLERFRSARKVYREEFVGMDSKDGFKKEVKLDDFNFVEKHDWIKFRMNSYLENSQSAINLLKQFYYFEDLEWLEEEYYSKLPKTDSNRNLTLSELNKQFTFSLYLIGLKRLKETKVDFFGKLKPIGISIVYFMFCSKNLEIDLGEEKVFFKKIKGTNDCFFNPNSGIELTKKKEINSIRKAKKYLEKCYQTLEVDVSWISKGQLFHHLLFENNIPNWERIELFYGKYLIPMNEILIIPRNILNISQKNKMNILQFLFWEILEIATRCGISENMNYPQEYVEKLEFFQNTPRLIENKCRMSRLLSHVDDRMFKLLEEGEFSFVKMVKYFDMFNESNLEQIVPQKKSNFKPFKWFDFVKLSIGTKSQNPFLIERNVPKLDYLFQELR